jgi:hypothetical protein
MSSTVEDLGRRAIPTAHLERFAGNPRTHDDAGLDESVDEFGGQYKSVLVRELDDGRLVVLAGNGTVDALERAGHEEIRADVIRCDDQAARKIVAADNRWGERGGYDKTLLAGLLASLDDDLVGTGYDDTFLDELLRSDVLGEQASGFLAGLGEDAPPSPESGLGGPPGPGDTMPGGDLVAVTWLVTGEQWTVVRKALAEAQEEHGTQTSALALVALCAAYLEQRSAATG